MKILLIKILSLILIISSFNILYPFFISPYINYNFNSDSEFYPTSGQNLNYLHIGLNFNHNHEKIQLFSNFSYHLYDGINQKPNDFNSFGGFGFIENNSGLSSKQFNYFFTSMRMTYNKQNFNFYMALDNPKWGPGINKIVLSDKAPPFFNIGYQWKLTDKLSYEHLYGKLNSLIEDTLYLNLYDTDDSRFSELPRAINAHRIDYTASDVLSIGLFEMIVYGGYRKVEPYYLLPLIPFLPIQTYLGDLDNDLLGTYININLKNVKFYSSLAIDEWVPLDTFKKNHKNWFVYQFGIIFKPNFFKGFKESITIEYIQSDNRVYNHKFPINSFYSYDYPLGFWGGPHAEQFYFFYIQESKKVDFKIEVSHSKRGESIYGYGNNFIDRYSGTVERKQKITLSANYRYNKRINYNFGFSIISWNNAGFNPFNENTEKRNIVKKDIQIGINYDFKEYKL